MNQEKWKRHSTMGKNLIKGLFLDVGKTKVMVINQQEEYPHIHAGNEDIEIVDQFNFLGSMISNQGGCSVEIRRRIGMAKTSMCSMNKLWKDRNISKATKIPLDPACLIFDFSHFNICM